MGKLFLYWLLMKVIIKKIQNGSLRCLSFSYSLSLPQYNCNPQLNPLISLAIQSYTALLFLLKRTCPAELKHAWTRPPGKMRKRLGWNYRNHWPFSWNYRLQRWLSKPAWCLITNHLGSINPKSVIRTALPSLQESKLFSWLRLFPSLPLHLWV